MFTDLQTISKNFILKSLYLFIMKPKNKSWT